MRKDVFNRTKKTISRHPVCLSDSEYNDILEEIVHQEENVLERDVEGYIDDEESEYENFK